MKAIFLLVLLFVSSTALASEIGGRALKEVGSESDIDLAAFVVRTAPLSRFGQPKPEFAAGLLHEADINRMFVSYGLVWQIESTTRFGVFFSEFSFAPTLLGGAKFEKKDLGGNLQFTSGLGLRWKPAPLSSLSLGLRFQHISNGSIRSTNPGMDSLGLELVWAPTNGE